MKTPRNRIARTIADMTLENGSTKKLTSQVAAYLLQDRRVGELDSIMRDIQSDWAEAGHVEVLAASAHPFSQTIKKDITSQVKHIYPRAKDIIVTEVHDPTIKGGVRISLAKQQLDLSVQAKLNKFKQLTLQGKE